MSEKICECGHGLDSHSIAQPFGRLICDYLECECKSFVWASGDEKTEAELRGERA